MFAEFRGGATAFALEDAVEVGDVVETAAIADFLDGEHASGEHPGGVAEAGLDDIVGERAAGVELEEAAEGSRRHEDDLGHGLEADLLVEMLVDILLHLVDAARVGDVPGAGETAGGEGAVIVVFGEIVEQLEEFQHAVEIILGLGDLHQAGVIAHDRAGAESHAVSGAFAECGHRPHLVLLEKDLSEELGLELDCDLADFLALALVLLPDMLEVAAYEHEVELSEGLHGVTHDAARPIAVFHEIELEFLMDMDGIVELRLAAVDQVEAIFRFERSDFGYYIFHRRQDW